MNISVRIFLGYFLVVGVAGWLFLQTFTAELKPGMRQSLEEVLVDVANLLAEMAQTELQQGSLDQGQLNRAMQQFGERRLNARIWSWQKRHPGMSVYITDANGIVVYDSQGRHVGEDYSQWNDVYLTLRGQYGARTTRSEPDNELTSVMYVAAPIRDGDRIIGVLTVGKPSISVQPFIDAAVLNLQYKGLWLVVLSLGLGLLLSFWLTHSIRRLTRYADAVSKGERIGVPKLREKELSLLANAMESMRTELEGKHYVENYLHSLTHELKSPLAAIHGAGELLKEPLPEADRQRFVANIANESLRMQQIVDRMLALASVEKRRQLEQVTHIALDQLVAELLESRQLLLQQKQLRIQTAYQGTTQVEGEEFLLRQAIGNLLDNAIDFSPQNGTIKLTIPSSGNELHLTVADTGPGIPDYAQTRLFDRFYSLQRPDGSGKSTGLGLSLVREVATLHGGEISLHNGENGGAVAALHLPLTQPHKTPTPGT